MPNDLSLTEQLVEERRLAKKARDRARYLKNREQLIKGAVLRHKRNREKRNTAARAWEARNPEERKKRNRGYMLKRYYNLTEDQYDAMFLAQNGCCAICGMGQSEIARNRLFVDHNHKTGKVRALLCLHCNHVLGQARESIDVLKSSIAYLEKHA